MKYIQEKIGEIDKEDRCHVFKTVFMVVSIDTTQHINL